MTADQVAQTAEYLRHHLRPDPEAILILGSGLGSVADEISDPVRLPYDKIPGFPRSTVTGHEGALVRGSWAGIEVVAMAGRFHLYEGWSPLEIALPIRALATLGSKLMVVTNAAGGLKSGLQPGDLMLIADHLNLIWKNPLIGPVLNGEQRFPDMSDPYDADFRRQVEGVALELGIRLQQGVYAALPGPSYETPAEVRMLARLGADAVGMSTVPETLVARAIGLRVLGISCITNLAAGFSGAALSHDEVMDVGEAARELMARLVAATLPRLVDLASR